MNCAEHNGFTLDCSGCSAELQRRKDTIRAQSLMSECTFAEWLEAAKRGPLDRGVRLLVGVTAEEVRALKVWCVDVIRPYEHGSIVLVADEWTDISRTGDQIRIDLNRERRGLPPETWG